RHRGRDSRPWALRGVLRAYRRRPPEPASACQSSRLLGDGVLVSAEDAAGDAETRALVKRLARPHPSGGDVVERAALLASGDFAAPLRWCGDPRGGAQAL